MSREVREHSSEVVGVIMSPAEDRIAVVAHDAAHGLPVPESCAVTVIDVRGTGERAVTALAPAVRGCDQRVQLRQRQAVPVCLLPARVTSGVARIPCGLLCAGLRSLMLGVRCSAPGLVARCAQAAGHRGPVRVTFRRGHAGARVHVALSSALCPVALRAESPREVRLVRVAVSHTHAESLQRAFTVQAQYAQQTDEQPGTPATDTGSEAPNTPGETDG